MAKVSFGNTPTLAPEAPVSEQVPTVGATTTALAPSAPLPPPVPAAPSMFDDESMDAGDLVLPRLCIVQKVGELSNSYQGGTIVLGSQIGGWLVLSDAPKGKDLSKPIRIVVLGFQRVRYVEKVEGGLRGQMCDTPQQVAAAGGTLDYNEAKATGKPLYQSSTTALVVIEQPEGIDSGSFILDIEGKRYAPALCTLKASAYTNGAKPIKSARKVGHPSATREWSDAYKSGGHRFGFWNVAAQQRQNGPNFYYVPVPTPAGLTTEAFRNAVSEQLGL